MQETSQRYRGRFAPSPTGPLHFGSMVTAVGSYLEARVNNGKWLVRIDDLDQHRCIEGMDKIILDTLESSGMYWDENIIYQTQHISCYKDALNDLDKKKLVYPCGCTRKEIASIAETGIEGPVYPGTCRKGLPLGKTERSTRIICPADSVEVNDRIQRGIKQNLKSDVGDFIIRRADGLFAYQLAVVVDDHIQEITDIVRGSDLMDSTPRQIWLQQALEYQIPRYTHIPVATHPDGRKLSKQTFAKPVDKRHLLLTLIKTLEFLNQQPVSELAEGDIDSFWSWAMDNWDIRRVPSVRGMPLDEVPGD